MTTSPSGPIWPPRPADQSAGGDPPGFGVVQPIDFIPPGATPPPYPASQPPPSAPLYPPATPPYPPATPPYPPAAPSYPRQPSQPVQPPLAYLGQPPAQPGQPTAQPTAKPRRRRLPVVITSLVLAVALVVVAVPLILRQTPLGRTPVRLVEQYLTDLAAGHAAQALKHGLAQPNDPTMLTDAVLAAALATNPIGDIDVPANQTVVGDSGEVTASYVIGGLEVEALFAVSKVAGVWMLDSAFASLDLSHLPTGVPLTLGGADITGKPSIDVLPGIYQLEVANPMLTVLDNNLVVARPGAVVRLDTGLKLSRLGAERIRRAATTALDACLSATALAPSGCGFDFDRFYAPVADETTVFRHLATGSGDLSEMALWLDYGSTSTASGFPNLVIQFEFTSTSGRPYRLVDYLYDVTANFSDPDNIIITFN